MREIAVRRSYAKLNLHLAIQRKRSDGFHDISSLFQRISLFDTVTFRVTADSSFECRITGMTCENNIMVAAAKRFMLATGLHFRIAIEIVKRIPIGGGLGGGSSNAAAVLTYLQEHFNHPLSQAELAELAAETGSDVPFFLADTPAAYVSGRGEVLFPIPCTGKYWTVVVFPGFHISTAAAFREWDRQSPSSRKRSVETGRALLIEQLCERTPDAWCFSNSFTSQTLQANSLYGQVFRLLAACNSGYSNLTGSGSACYGVFSTREAAEAAAAVLRSELPDRGVLCLTADFC